MIIGPFPSWRMLLYISMSFEHLQSYEVHHLLQKYVGCPNLEQKLESPMTGGGIPNKDHLLRNSFQLRRTFKNITLPSKKTWQSEKMDHLRIIFGIYSFKFSIDKNCYLRFISDSSYTVNYFDQQTLFSKKNTTTKTHTFRVEAASKRLVEPRFGGTQR